MADPSKDILQTDRLLVGDQVEITQDFLMILRRSGRRLELKRRSDETYDRLLLFSALEQAEALCESLPEDLADEELEYIDSRSAVEESALLSLEERTLRIQKLLQHLSTQTPFSFREHRVRPVSSTKSFRRLRHPLLDPLSGIAKRTQRQRARASPRSGASVVLDFEDMEAIALFTSAPVQQFQFRMCFF